MKIRYVMAAMLMILAFSLVACKPGDYNLNTNIAVRDAAPDEKARAELLYAQADRERMQTEQDRQRSQIETDLLAQTAKINQQLSIEQRRAEIEANVQKANAEAAVFQSRGQAEVRAIDTKSATDTQTRLSNAKAWATFVTVSSYGLVAVVCGFAFALVIVVAGRSAAQAKYHWAMADYLLLQAGNKDLPPLIVTRSGYLLDTLTGERSRISDPSGVNQLRTAAMTRLLEASALAHAAATVGRDNRQKLAGGIAAADVMPGIAASIPLMLPVRAQEQIEGD